MFTHSRWTAGRKKDALSAISKGLLSRSAFMEANNISEDEMAEWESGHLRATRRRKR